MKLQVSRNELNHHCRRHYHSAQKKNIHDEPKKCNRHCTGQQEGNGRI